MHRIKLMVGSASITVVLLVLAQHPRILTSGASLTQSYGRLGAHVDSYGLRILMGLIGLVIAGFGVQQSIKLRSVRKRRASIKLVEGTETRPERELRNMPDR